VTWLPRRIRGGVAAIASLVLIPLATLAISAPSSAWDHWRYWRTIDLPATDVTRLVQVRIADEIFLRSGITLDDLRVIDDQGSERPFTVFVLSGTKKTESLAATLHERSFVPGQYTQAVVEIKGDAPFHNSLEVDTPEQNFIEWVSVDASDDARTWRIVEERAPIFRFVKDGREGTRVVQYSDNNARYLRIRIFNGERQFPIAGVEVLREVSRGAEERVPVDVPIVPDARAPEGQSVWMADMGGRGLPVSEVRFDMEPIEFVRCVTLATSNDKKEWSTDAPGQIYRFHRGEKVQQVLTVPIGYGGGARYWRISVDNGNDAPLPVRNVQLYTSPRHLMFEQQPGRSYSLIYGQERAEAARYDFGERVNEEGRLKALPGKLGPEEVNATWVDPRPWTETHAVFLWGVLLIAVIVIGFTAVQSMRRAAGNPQA
jgi:Protein of unknown function (DUF3999)